MGEMEPDSIDAIVCDPPYGLEFMGKEWDSFAPDNNVFHMSPADTTKNIGNDHSKPGSRHRVQHNTGGRSAFRRCLVCGKREWSGSPCRCESPEWKYEYPEGTPRRLVAYQSWTQAWATAALRVLKPGGSMLTFGGTRTFHRLTCGVEDAGFIIKDCLMWLYGQGFPKAQDLGKMIDKRAGVEREVVGSEVLKGNAAVSAADKGGTYIAGQKLTGVKEIDITLPATDLARHWDGYKIGGIKPAWEPVVWAVKPPEGAYLDNVLKWGVGAVNVGETRIGTEAWTRKGGNNSTPYGSERTWSTSKTPDIDRTCAGRFPANLLLDEEAARMLDEQSGVRPTGGLKPYREKGTSWFTEHEVREVHKEADTGGASRFFYTSKATDRAPYNDHPTLKPTDLIEWLIRLVTRPGQTVLDPFAGSGTTGVAAVQSGREYVLVEQDEHYCEIAERRLSEVQMGMF